jgi:hypothetical protein
MLSTFLSFLMGGLPKILDFFQDKSDKKHELELAKMQTERELQLLAAGYAAQQKVEEIKLEEIQTQSAADTKQSLIQAQQSEMEAIYAHDIAIGQGASQWMVNYRTSVRPTITYGFFFLLCAIDAVLAYKGFEAGVSFTDMANQLWDDETQSLFAAIIAFHFGGRAFGK